MTDAAAAEEAGWATARTLAGWPVIVAADGYAIRRPEPIGG